MFVENDYNIDKTETSFKSFNNLIQYLSFVIYNYIKVIGIETNDNFCYTYNANRKFLVRYIVFRYIACA